MFCLCLLIILLIFNPVYSNECNTFKVLKIIDGDTFYIDFNNNNKCDKGEKVRVNGIDTFEIRTGARLEKQIKQYNLTKAETLALGYLGKDFAKKHLLNKYVKVEYSAKTKTDRYGRPLVSIYYNCRKNGQCKSYEKEILKEGLAVVYPYSNLKKALKPYEDMERVRKRAQKARNSNLLMIDKKNGVYHKLNCEETLNINHFEIISKKHFPKYYSTSECCFKNKNAKPITSNFDISKINNGEIKLFYTDPIKFKRPQKNCVNDNCVSLLNLIKNAQSEIKFAIYGYSGQEEILTALKEAKNRGVKIYGIVDKDVRNYNVYRETDILLREIEGIKSDYFEDLRVLGTKLDRYNEKLKIDPSANFDIRSAIMHNKFFIIDNIYIWTGSTNVTENCMSYNSNVSALIKSEKVAELYNNEFNQMYFENKFHTSKKQSGLQNKNLKINNNTQVSVFFSPQDKVISTELIPLIQNAKNYIYTPIFYLTHIGVVENLIQAHKRGVDVKVIIDANSASNKFSKHKLLRENGVSVKTENWGGKMHMKSVIIDDKYVVIASMNWTKSAENINDENTLVIQNAQLAQNFKKEFMRLWQVIPNKWLADDPKAESPDSINSCFDGVDNNHNGYYDSEEFACKALFNEYL